MQFQLQYNQPKLRNVESLVSGGEDRPEGMIHRRIKKDRELLKLSLSYMIQMFR